MSKTFADIDPGVFGPNRTRTEPVRTLDDLHDSELREVLQWAADNLPELHEADEHGRLGWRTDAEMKARRESVVRFDAVSLPRVRRSSRTVNHTPWFLMWLPRPRRAVLDLLLFADAVLEKIQTEDGAGLEQFGPIKRAVNDALNDQP